MTDDLYDESLEDDDEEQEDETEEVPVAEEKTAPEKSAAPEPTAEQQQLAELGLNALKQSFVEAAKSAGYVAADFDGIGLKGIDESAKAAFVAEAKASHEAKVAALAAQGFVFQPQAQQAAAQEAAEAEAAQQWGSAGPGQAASGDEKFTNVVQEEVKRGDVVGVIGSLVGQGGLGEFFIRGRKGK